MYSYLLITRELSIVRSPSDISCLWKSLISCCLLTESMNLLSSRHSGISGRAMGTGFVCLYILSTSMSSSSTSTAHPRVKASPRRQTTKPSTSAPAIRSPNRVSDPYADLAYQHFSRSQRSRTGTTGAKPGSTLSKKRDNGGKNCRLGISQRRNSRREGVHYRRSGGVISARPPGDQNRHWISYASWTT